MHVAKFWKQYWANTLAWMRQIYLQLLNSYLRYVVIYKNWNTVEVNARSNGAYKTDKQLFYWRQWVKTLSVLKKPPHFPYCLTILYSSLILSFPFHFVSYLQMEEHWKRIRWGWRSELCVLPQHRHHRSKSFSLIPMRPLPADHHFASTRHL